MSSMRYEKIEEDGGKTLRGKKMEEDGGERLRVKKTRDNLRIIWLRQCRGGSVTYFRLNPHLNVIYVSVR